MTIYLDHAAATPVDSEVFNIMEIYWRDGFANASGAYRSARMARAAIDNARKTVAEILHCEPEEIFFTSGGTEANNWALFGTANATSKKHLITSRIEHQSILSPAQELERRGYNVTFLPVDGEGFVEISELQKKITPETFLVSIMYGQNEIGTIENIEKLANIVHNQGSLFHTDACQAAGALELNTTKLKIDLMTLNGGKIYGPKGSGCLYIKKGTAITPLLYGGGQEHRLRAGTENVAAIVGFAEALKKAEKMREQESRRLAKLRDDFLQKITNIFPKVRLNGSPTNRLPNNLHLTFPDVDAESLLIKLDLQGVCASAGSACTSGSFEPSHVLLGIGLTPEFAKNSVRFTLGRENTAEDIDKTVEILKIVLQ